MMLFAGSVMVLGGLAVELAPRINTSTIFRKGLGFVVFLIGAIMMDAALK
jgi:hypothetical protein